MGLSYRIYPAAGSGASGAGGGPSTTPGNLIVNNSFTSPYKGRGTRYVYKKFFLSITNFDDSYNAPTISNVAISNITASGAKISWSVNQSTTTELDYGSAPTYGLVISSGASLASGDRFVNLTGLYGNALYYYRVVATNAEGLSAASLGTFNTLDIVAPVLSNVAVNNIATDSALVSWTTDEPATTYLVYGLSAGSLTNTITYDSTLSTSHIVNLTSLSEDTSYYYKAISLDASSNSGQSSTQSFITLTATGAPPLALSSISSGSITDSGANITWTTNNQANTQVKYALSIFDLTGQSGSYNSYFNATTSLGHTGSLTNLTPGQAYYFKVSSTDIYGQTVESPSTQTGYRFNTVDTLPPAITFSGISTTQTGAVLSFITNESATGRLDYDDLTHYLFNGGTFRSHYYQSSLSTGHVITLTGLTGPIDYACQYVAADSSGNVSYDNIRFFSTIDTTAPTISNIITGGNTGQVSLSWTTDELSNSIASLGTTTAYENGTKTGNGGALVTDHTVRFFNLTPDTNYVWRISSVDSNNNTGSATGLVNTLPLPSSGDITPPNIYNILTVPSYNSASISWDTDEYSSTEIEYTASSFPGTGAVGASGTIGHIVSITSLPSSQTIQYKITSKDASDNSTTLSGLSFTTSAEPTGSSTFNEGDRVANFEFQIPDDLQSYSVIPCRITVPVRSNDDLILPWVTDQGYYVQREVIKRDANDNAKIVECVFPIFNQEASYGGIYTGYLNASASEQIVTWDQYELPSDLTLKVVMPDGEIGSASLVSPTNGIVRQVRGNGTSSFCRTFKFYNRIQVTTPNAYHPASKSVGVHVYVTYFNKNIFGQNYMPLIDIRVSNAWIDETAPATRGPIYFQSMYIDHPTSQPDGIPVRLIPDLMSHAMSFDVQRLVLIKPLSQMPHNPHPTNDPNVWVGGSSAAYNQYYTNDTSNHVFLPGYALEYRLALYNASFDSVGSNFYKTIGTFMANMENIGFCVEDGSYDYRSWATERSFGPLNVRCPNLTSNYTSNGKVGRDAFDSNCKILYDGIRANLTDGTYVVPSPNNTNLLGPSIGTVPGQSNNHYPIEFGPYRPEGPTDGGYPGGTQITPFDGFNHSKYALLYKKEEHKMKMARHPHHMYSAASVFNDDGEPSSVARWAQVYNGTNNTQRNGGENIVGLVPFDFTLDFQMPYFKYYYSETNSGLAPWNAPTIPVTASHLLGEGCSYNDDRVTYSNYTGNSSNNRYHLNDRYGVIDHAHQIRYASNLITLSEFANDIMTKDDLIMQAEANMLSFSHYPTTNTYYANGYNLVDMYYGYVKQNLSYQSSGIIINKNQGIGYGRVAGWPLFTTVAAYTLGNSTFRSTASNNLLLWGKILKDSVLPIGSFTRMYNPTILIQHPGLYHNGVELHLSTTSYPYISNYLYATVNSPGLANTTTTVKSSDGEKLVNQWTISNGTDSYVPDPYSLSLTNSIGWGLVLKKDDWLNGSFVAKIWGYISAQTGSQSFQYVLKAYLINSSTGVETLISDSVNSSSLINATALQLNTWSVKQKNPTTNLWESFNIPYNSGYDRLAFKLYVKTSSTNNITVTTNFGSISGTDNRSRIVTPLQNIYGCIYDHAQVFETHILNMSAYAVANNVLKYLDPASNSTILTSLRSFYNNFYNMNPDNPSVPGWIPNSSAWLSNGSSAAESWVIGVALNANYPAVGAQGPLTYLTTAAGRYANERSEDRDGTQYAPWSSFIGMLAEEDLGYDFTNTVSNTAFNNGFLLGRWCLMSTAHVGANAATNHRNFIESASTSSIGALYVTNASACIGHINYREANPLVAPASSPATSVRNVRIFVANENNPFRTELAATPNQLDYMTGASLIDGSQTGAVWAQAGVVTDSPVFRRARGVSESIQLYNNSGELGGPIGISTSSDDAVPFWIRIRLDENTTDPTGYIQFGVNASR